MRFYFLYAIVFCLPVSLLAQSDDTALIKQKAKAIEHLVVPRTDLATSTFALFKKAVEYSQSKDSIKAGELMAQVDPYYLMFIGQTEKSIDTFLSRYCLTAPARSICRQQFLAAWSQSRPGIYQKLQAMHKETLRLLYQLDTAGGKLKAAIETKIEKADSVHFRILYDYVSKNGWPDMQHGSLFAGAIARRDIMHCYDYLPIMLEAFKKGELPVVDLLFVEFNKRYYPDLVTMRDYLSGECEQYDISPMLAEEMPININEIIAEIRKDCPIRNVVALQQSPRKLYSKKVIGDYQGSGNDHFSDRWLHFTSDMYDACFMWRKARTNDHGIRTYWLPWDRKEERLTLYVIKARP